MIARLDRLRRSPLGLAVLHVARVYAVGLAVLKVDQAVRRYHGAPPAQLVATVATTPTKVDPPEPTFDELLDAVDDFVIVPTPDGEDVASVEAAPCPGGDDCPHGLCAGGLECDDACRCSCEQMRAELAQVTDGPG